MLDSITDFLFVLFRGFLIIILLTAIFTTPVENYKKYFNSFFKWYFGILKGIFNNSFSNKLSELMDAAQEYELEHGKFSNKSKLSGTSATVLMLLFSEIKEKYEWKFDEELTDTDKSVIIGLFISGGVDYNDCVDYVNNHPIVSAYLIDKFVELYHQRKMQNEPINILELQAFIQTAKFFK